MLWRAHTYDRRVWMGGWGVVLPSEGCSTTLSAIDSSTCTLDLRHKQHRSFCTFSQRRAARLAMVESHSISEGTTRCGGVCLFCHVKGYMCVGEYIYVFSVYIEYLNVGDVSCVHQSLRNVVTVVLSTVLTKSFAAFSAYWARGCQLGFRWTAVSSCMCTWPENRLRDGYIIRNY